MNIRHTFYIGLLIVLVALGSVGAYKLTEQRVAGDHLVPPIAPPVQPPVAEPPAAVPPATELVSQVFENEYMKLTVPAGWKLEELAKPLPDHIYNKATGTQVDDVPPTPAPAPAKTGAVNITKDSYILYIHPHASQASGVTGGRFAEIAMGAPSADAVVTEQPSPPCGQAVSGGSVSIPGVNLTRKDLYVSKADKKDYCAVPTTGTSWYFSYITNSKGGYINYYKADELPGYVITMAYNSKDVNALPQKGTAELTAALADMTGIVKTLVLKQWDKIAR